MNIGFIDNHLSIRGTSIALFEYAHFNETLLYNNSFIITRKYGTRYLASCRLACIKKYSFGHFQIF